MSTRLHDLLVRVVRTFLQAAIPVFLVTAWQPLQAIINDLMNAGSGGGSIPEAHVDALRSALIAVVIAGVVAIGSLIHNLLNDYAGIATNTPLIGKPVDRAIGDAQMGEQA
jgi:hypothetical protein